MDAVLIQRDDVVLWWGGEPIQIVTRLEPELLPLVDGSVVVGVMVEALHGPGQGREARVGLSCPPDQRGHQEASGSTVRHHRRRSSGVE